MTQPSKPKRSWFKILLLCMLLLLAGALAMAIVMANPSFPETPDLDAISLELPRTEPAAKQLAALLETKRKLRFDLDASPFKEAVAAIKTGRWLDEPAEVIKALDELDKPSLATFRAALMERGCLPEEEFKVDAERYSLINLIRAAQLMAARAVALTQTGQPSQALAYLGPVHDRLQQLEERCASNLLGTMVLEVALSNIRPAWGHLLASEGLSDELRQQVWRRLRSMESRKNPLPDALRQEDRFLGSALASVKEQSKKGGEEHLTTWPWFDQEDTLKLQRVLSKRRVWLARQPLDSDAWSKTFPETAYFDAIRDRPPWLILARYNGTGKTLVAIAAPAFNKYTFKWHQNRCLAAAHRARWARELKTRGRKLIKDATTPAPLDPFTKKTFSNQGEQCAVPDRFLRGTSALKAQTVVPLPPAPPPLPPAAASQPAPEPAANK
jgi:hypothetical protein